MLPEAFRAASEKLLERCLQDQARFTLNVSERLSYSPVFVLR